MTLNNRRESLDDRQILVGNRETLPTGEVAIKMGSCAQSIRDLSACAQAEGLGLLDPELAGTIKDLTDEREVSYPAWSA